MPSYITQAMSKINITEADIGRKFVTKRGDIHTILRIEKGNYPVRVSDQFGYTKELKWWDSGQPDLNDFSHWADEPAPPARTPEWWATFNAVLPAFIEITNGKGEWVRDAVELATEITNEAHK